MSYRTDQSRVLYSTSQSLLDCIFVDGYGDAAFAVQTKDNVSELLRADPATRSLYAVAVIAWPTKRGDKTTIQALDLRRHPPGVIPPLRDICPCTLGAQWFHTIMALGKDTYERYATLDSHGVVRRSMIIRKRLRRGVSAGLSVVGLDSLLKPAEQSCEIRLIPDGYLRDDADTVLAAIVLLSGKRDWKTVQSELTLTQLECCLNVSRLKMNQKWDESAEHAPEDVLC